MLQSMLQSMLVPEVEAAHARVVGRQDRRTLAFLERIPCVPDENLY